MKNRKFVLLSVLLFFVIVCISVFLLFQKHTVSSGLQTKWKIQSIDVMKYSRDEARENSKNPVYETNIDKMMVDIAATGASYVAIGTPYDDEFIPYLSLWVKSARRHGLKVWFRGNFAGWEGWFNYPKIDRAQHEQLLGSFIINNSELFEDGDIFSPCPECENGGPGDPRQTGDVVNYRKFLLTETEIANRSFMQIGKSIPANYHSMNADVAHLVMDKATTRQLGGIVVIDHYVATPQELNAGVNSIAISSGGKVILGEFGVPIPDLNGDLTQQEQAQWLNEALTLLKQNKNLVGLSYWVNMGGSTALWSDSGRPRKAVSIITSFYTAK